MILTLSTSQVVHARTCTSAATTRMLLDPLPIRSLACTKGRHRLPFVRGSKAPWDVADVWLENIWELSRAAFTAGAFICPSERAREWRSREGIRAGKLELVIEHFFQWFRGFGERMPRLTGLFCYGVKDKHKFSHEKAKCKPTFNIMTAIHFDLSLFAAVSRLIRSIGSLRNDDGDGNNNATKEWYHWLKDHE